MEKIKKGEILNDEKEEINKNYEQTIKEGVEIVDVKAVLKKEKPVLDKFGIPIPKTRSTWDKL